MELHVQGAESQVHTGAKVHKREVKPCRARLKIRGYTGKSTHSALCSQMKTKHGIAINFSFTFNTQREIYSTSIHWVSSNTALWIRNHYTTQDPMYFTVCAWGKTTADVQRSPVTELWVRESVWPKVTWWILLGFASSRSTLTTKIKYFTSNTYRLLRHKTF